MAGLGLVEALTNAEEGDEVVLVIAIVGLLLLESLLDKTVPGGKVLTGVCSLLVTFVTTFMSGIVLPCVWLGVKIAAETGAGAGAGTGRGAGAGVDDWVVTVAGASGTRTMVMG